MKLIHTNKELNLEIALARSQGKRIGFVPTMGALHKGHLSLVSIAKAHADFVVVSVFVNPLQFNEGEDFDKYPRSIGQDARLLTDNQVDVLYAPSAQEIYPKDFEIPRLTAGHLGERYEGAARPGHFDGMLTVVSRLFDLVKPDVAVFGEKDAQQVALVTQLLNDQIRSGRRSPMALKIGPTVREESGLALSSRNVRLSDSEKQVAQSLSRALFAGAKAGSDSETIKSTALGLLDPEAKLEYLELVDALSFEPISSIGPNPARLIIAAQVGKVRLIDNVLIDGKK